MRCLDQLPYVVDHVLWLVARGVSPPGPAAVVHQELFKVPADVGSLDRPPGDLPRVVAEEVWPVGGRGQRLLEPREDGVLVLAVHLQPVEHDTVGLEAVPRADVRQRRQDLLPARVLLEPELVAREVEDGQAAGELLAQLVKLRVVPARDGSQGGRVDHQHHLPAEL